MNATQYAEYESAVAATLDDYALVTSGCAHDGCSDCRCEANEDSDYADCANVDPWFSRTWCDICNRPEGGNRYPVHGITKVGTPDSETHHFNACDDCVYYVEYGRLGDAAMDEIETSKDGEA